MLFTDDLYHKVLIEPTERGCDSLSIVSGYASAPFMMKHVTDIVERKLTGRSISLIIGMWPNIGNLFVNHVGFKRICESTEVNVACRYNSGVPNHTKAYLWSEGGIPKLAYVGSANYSSNGFVGFQNELLYEANPLLVATYIENCKLSSQLCNEPQVESAVTELITKSSPSTGYLDYTRAPVDVTTNKIELSLLDKSNSVPAISGLNWGQRPGREPNQAYISIPSNVTKSGFFPLIRNPFSVICDDGAVLFCVTAQPKKKGELDGHAIHTRDNSDLGKYIRRRIGVPLGEKVSLDNLRTYGRTSVTIVKLDNENYALDFSTSSKR